MRRSSKDEVLFRGPGAIIVAEVDENGAGLVVKYLLNLKRKRPEQFRKAQALLSKAAEIGPQNIKNSKKVRPLEGKLLEFKADQVRIFWMYGTSRNSKRTVILLDGLIKKQGKHKRKDIERAQAMITRRMEEGRT